MRRLNASASAAARSAGCWDRDRDGFRSVSTGDRDVQARRDRAQRVAGSDDVELRHAAVLSRLVLRAVGDRGAGAHEAWCGGQASNARSGRPRLLPQRVRSAPRSARFWPPSQGDHTSGRRRLPAGAARRGRHAYRPQMSSRRRAASLRARRPGLSAGPPRSKAYDDPSRGRHQAARRAGGEGRRQISAAAALGADTGKQQDGVGHQRAQRLQPLRRGGPDDGARRRTAPRPPTPGRPSSPTIAGQRPR